MPSWKQLRDEFMGWDEDPRTVNPSDYSGGPAGGLPFGGAVVAYRDGVVPVDEVMDRDGRWYKGGRK